MQKIFYSVSEIIYIRMFNTLYQNDWVFSLTKFGDSFKKGIAIVREFTDSIIVKRRNELIKENEAKQNGISIEEDSDVPKKKMALLDILLQSEIDGQPLTNEDIREEVDTFMFAVSFKRAINDFGNVFILFL